MRSVLLDDSEGICGRLDEEVERTAVSFQDPWLEGMRPVHPTQFSEMVETVSVGGTP